jgi:outer membrane protein assembly factor BamB
MIATECISSDALEIRYEGTPEITEMARHRSSLSKLNWRSLLGWIGVLLVVGWGLSWFLTQTTPYLLALDAKTGDVRWTVMQNFVGSAAIANQQVLIQHFSRAEDQNYRWNLTALNAESGKQQWGFQFDETVEENYAVPLYISSNTLYAFLEQGSFPTRSQLVAIDVNTGQLRWKKSTALDATSRARDCG